VKGTDIRVEGRCEHLSCAMESTKVGNHFKLSSERDAVAAKRVSQEVPRFRNFPTEKLTLRAGSRAACIERRVNRRFGKRSIPPSSCQPAFVRKSQRLFRNLSGHTQRSARSVTILANANGE